MDEHKYAPNHPMIAEAIAIPQVQDMKGYRTGFENARGVAIRQVTQLGEALAQSLTGLPFEKKNKYKVGVLPPGKNALHYKGDPQGWKPTRLELEALNSDIFAQEESELCLRFALGLLGCQNLRPLTMKFWLPENTVGLEVDRPFNLGGCLCCPHESTARIGTAVVGRVEEDVHCGKNYWLRCCQGGFCCKAYYDFQVPNNLGTFDPKYQLEVNTACCGPHNNFCGATPCANDMLFNVYQYKSGIVDYNQPVGHIQKTYGGGDCSCAALFRFCYMFNNYVVEFPENSTVQDKALFMAGFVNTEYIHFENTGDSN